MKSNQYIIFGTYRLDLVNECLWCNEQAFALAPKEFAVLRYLVSHPGQLVTKEELIEAVWPETAVTEGVLKVSIRKIRSTLGDDSKLPQFIETAHRRGYRFIGQITEQIYTEPLRRSEMHRPDAHLPSRFSASPALDLVGREAALKQMRNHLERALSGERQIIFITGEAGIGKTTLVEAFLKMAASDPRLLIGQGQCLEQYGAGEAYLPVLEAVSRLCQEPGRERLVELLRSHAPTWLQQIPALVNASDREALKRDVFGATPERMLREMAEALEVLTAETPLVMVFEDLHWSDYSTLDLVSYLGRRRKPAQLLLIATYRPVEVALSEHPLKGVKQELQAHRQCEEMPLEYLSRNIVGEYLAARFPNNQFPDAFTTLLHERTDGTPLFLVNAVDYLQAEGLIAEVEGEWKLTVELSTLQVGVPESIRQIIEKQIERLSRDQQRVLEVASVAGVEFPAAAVAAGLEQDLMQIEDQCEELERKHQLLRTTGLGTLPDGLVTARYTFIHALYQQVLYQRLAPGRRARFHQLIGLRGEEVYGARSSEVAAELAVHFEQGRDYQRAIKHLRQAAHNHSLRYANREAIAYLSRALELLARVTGAEHVEARMAVLEQLGLAHRAMGDMVGSASDFATLADYAHSQGKIEDEVKALIDLATVLSWVDRERCLAAAERFVALSRDLNNELLQMYARGAWAYWHVLFLEWGNDDAEALRGAVTAARQAGDRARLGLYLARYSFFECLQSNYEAACRAAKESAELALQVSDAHSYLLAQYYGVWGLLHLGKWGEMQRIVGEGGYGLEMAERNEHRQWAVLFRLEMVWLREQTFDFEQAREICEQAHEQAKNIQHPYTESLSLILLGLAYLGLEEHEAAFRCFNEIVTRLDRDRSLMDWVLRILLHHALSQYWLALREMEQARREAERVIEWATPPGEKTYLALANMTLAEIAISARDWNVAEITITRSLVLLEGTKAPMAEWRVCATAARLYEQLGRTMESAQYWQRAASVIKTLADSLGEGNPLRMSLLASSEAQNIQQRAEAYQ